MTDRVDEQEAKCSECEWRGPYSQLTITHERTYACPECNADAIDDTPERDNA